MGKIKAGTNIEVDDTALQAHLRDYAKVLGKSIETVLVEQAGLFCKDMVDYTPPLEYYGKGNMSNGGGLSLDARRNGQENVTRGVFKVIRAYDRQDIGAATVQMIADSNSYNVFKMWLDARSQGRFGTASRKRWKAFQEKYSSGGSIIVAGPGDLATIGKAHTAMRGDGGHGGIKSGSKVIAISREKDIYKYIKQKEKSVGTLKSGYYHAAQRIGAKSAFPAWVKQEEGASKAVGFKELADPMKPSVTVGNLIGKKIPSFRGWIERSVQNALNHRAYSMRAVMAAKLNKEKTPLWLATAQGKTSGTFQHFS
jgi:hypothetical protein